MTDTLTRKSPDIEKVLHPLPHSRSGYQNQGGATEKNLNTHLPCLVVEGAEAPSKKLMQYVRELKKEAQSRNIKIESIIRKIDMLLEGQ